MPTISGGARSEEVLVTGKMGHDTAPKVRNRRAGHALTGTGMDLISIARHFRHALARLPHARGGLRQPGATNRCLLVPLLDEITKARRRGIRWQMIAVELVRAGVHKLNGTPFTAADLRSYAWRASLRKE